MVCFSELGRGVNRISCRLKSATRFESHDPQDDGQAHRHYSREQTILDKSLPLLF
ncbi:MAG: hypothetical protein JO316_20690 [Abitibacteriaceae bacterium]|nr:hypothetical protein [Abditibacteriaceae bacterium]